MDTKQLTERVRALFSDSPADELGPSDEPESQYRFGYNTALEDVLEAIATLPSDAAGTPLSTWQMGTPTVPEGKCWEFIIAVRRAQSNPPGKVAVFSANYANKFTDDGCLSDRSGDEFIADGWYVCGLDMSGEYNEIFEPIGLNEGDEIVGWQDLPKWNAAAPVAPAAVAPSEDAYVAHRMTEVLAEVYGTIIGGDARPEDEALPVIERVKKAAQVLRLEVDLYRAQRAASAAQPYERTPSWLDGGAEAVAMAIEDGLLDAPANVASIHIDEALAQARADTWTVFPQGVIVDGAPAQPDERAAFEAAYIAHLNEQDLHARVSAADYTVDEIASLRVGDAYDAGFDLRYGYLNGCWWGWKAGRASLNEDHLRTSDRNCHPSEES